MTDTVNPPQPKEVPKPVTCRKSKSSQNALERWTHLEKSSARIRDRLIFNNRFENFHLDRHQEDIRSSEEEALRDIFRAKDHMRLSLIDLAQSRRHFRNNICDHERKIRKGSHSPVFSSERDQIKKKERELRGLQARLQGPNSVLLAEHVQDELKMIEYRNTIGLSDLHAAKTLPSIGTPVDQRFQSLNSEENGSLISEFRSGSQNDFDIHNKQHGDISKPKNYSRHQQSLQHPPSDVLGSLQHPLASDELVSNSETDSTGVKVHFENEPLMPKQIKSKNRQRPRHRLINSHSTGNKAREPATSVTATTDIEETSTKLSTKPTTNTDFSLPLSPVPEETPPSNILNNHRLPNLPESIALTADETVVQHSSDSDATGIAQPEASTSIEMTSLPSEESLTMQEDVLTAPLPPITSIQLGNVKKSKTSRGRTKMRRKLVKDKNTILGVVSVSEIAASRRERHAQKRLAEVRMKTDKQINKVTGSGNTRSSNQFDVTVPRSRKADLKVDSAVPVNNHRAIKLKKTCDDDIRLPPIRVDPHLLQELKRQRVKHRTESTKLPKLP